MTTLVTGGGGFLGAAVVRELLAKGHSVRSFSRQHYETLEALGVEQMQGDLADPAAVARAVDGCDLVFHIAAKAGIWGSYESFARANVLGTEHVLEACRKHGTPKLVYTSSPSVVFDGTDMEGVDESAPYPSRYEAHYPQTKAEAEQRVRRANGPQLATVCLRPHLIWGPGDNHLVPRVLAKGRARQLRRIGKQNKLIDWVYIDDAARAHVQAAECLAPDSPVAGKVYFITQGKPEPTWDLINQLLRAGDVAPVEKTIPIGVARMAASILEWSHRVFGLAGEPRMTRFLASELSTAHWFDISAARRDFGYEPRVSLEEALEHLRDSLLKSSTSTGVAA